MLPFSSDEDKFHYYADRGDHVREEGLPEAAAQEYRCALQNSEGIEAEDVSLIHFKLASTLHELHEDQEALAVCLEAIRFEPTEPVNFNLLGDIHATCERWPEALAAYHEALRLDPEYVDAYHNLAIALKESGDYKAAVQSYRQALRLAPDEPDIHYSLGNALRRLERWEESVGEYEIAIQLLPDYSDAFNNLGLSLEALGRHDEAEAAYQQGLEIAPADEMLRDNLSDLREWRAAEESLPEDTG